MKQEARQKGEMGFYVVGKEGNGVLFDEAREGNGASGVAGETFRSGFAVCVQLLQSTQFLLVSRVRSHMIFEIFESTK